MIPRSGGAAGDGRRRNGGRAIMDGAKRGGWPLGLFGMLALIGAAELAVSRWMDLVAPPLVMDWRATRRAAAREAVGCDVLCFGSSMVKNGVLPAVIEAGSGRRGYNLALPGGPPASAYFLLRRALDHGARPSAVVVDFHHQRLPVDPCAAENVAAWAQLLGPVEAFELTRRQRDPGDFPRLLVACLVPTVRVRLEIRAAVLGALGGRPVSQRDRGAAYARNRRVNRGAVVIPKAPAFQDLSGPSGSAGGEAGWWCHPVNAHFLRRFLDLTGERGVAVFWLMPPLSPGYQARIDGTRGVETYLRLVRRLVGRYPHLTVLDGRHAGLPATDFVDPVHLDKDGAAALSRSLAAVLGRTPGPPAGRWVELPPGRGASPGGGAGVEDVYQSASAVTARAGVARR